MTNSKLTVKGEDSFHIKSFLILTFFKRGIFIMLRHEQLWVMALLVKLEIV